MRKHFPTIILGMGLIFTSGCSSMTSTDKGVLGGGLIGGTAGALVGSATGHTGAGAVLGAALGGISGGLIGNEIEETDRKNQVRQAAAQVPVQGPLTLPDIAQMAQQGISDQVIIGQIRSTRSVYQLSPNDLQWLRTNGVSDTVVLEMQATAQRVPQPARVYGRHYHQPQVIIVEPYPPPPPPIGIGFSYTQVR